jgi:hypothetical protein
MAEQWSVAVKAIKDAAVTITQAAAPDALIINRFVFDPDDIQWAGMLRKSPTDPIHAICVSYDLFNFPYAGMSPVLGSAFPKLTLQWWFYQPYDDGDEVNNSEEALMAEIVKVTWAIGAKTDLGIREYVTGHEGLRTQRLDVKLFGKEPVQIAMATLDVIMKIKYIRGQ